MYKDYYNLHNNPFQMTPDPKIFFASKGHKRALSYLQYGLSQGEGFIVITGDIGTGKTTIVKNLIAGLDRQTFIAKELVTTHLEDHDLMEMICESFELISKGLSKAALLNQFKAFLNSANKLGRRVVLVVDEVQNLPAKTVEELRMLSNFQVENKPLIQSFLVGQKEFIQTLQADSMEQLRQRVIASCHLGPLKKDETKYYINYRLEESGWNGGRLFEDDALELIHQLTEGVPRRINVFCDRILLFGYLEEVTIFNREHIKVVADELADEITSPIKSERHEEIKSYIDTLQNDYTVRLEKTPELIEPKRNIEPQTVQQKTQTVPKEVQASKETLSSDFVDIEETIKDFESRVEKEIEAFKSSLDKKF
ncbi:MAG: AAA family ATPase [Gammaproteobacteria bacterium]|nr:AAA family ATPase [Gammaproteobacteria bacterium]